MRMQRSLLILGMAVSIALSTTASAIRTVGTFDVSGAAYDIRVVGDLAYVAAGDSGLRIVDISDPTARVGFDSDGDGYGDGTEVLLMGTDPLDPLDPAPAPAPGRRGIHNRRR
jgi:hypothetical protein